MQILKSKLTRIYGSSFLALMVWSSWAFFVNFNSENAFQSALMQGSYSFLGTLIMAHFIEGIFERMTGKAKFYLAWLGPYLILVPILIMGHLIVETENILFTILPSISIGLLYSFAYVTELKRHEKHLTA